MKISANKLNLRMGMSIISLICASIHTGIWTIVFLGMMFDDFQENVGVFLFCALLLALGIFWFCKAKKRQDFLRLCGKYFTALQQKTCISVPQLAAILKEDPSNVRQNLTTMISCGYLPRVTLNVRDDCITVHPAPKSQPLFVPMFQKQMETQPQQPKKEQTVTVPITCKACMGITMLPVHSEGICDYCGSKIKS